VTTTSLLARLPADDASPDEDVVARVLAGDKPQFAILVRRYNQRVFRAARAVLRDDSEADDVVQQAWLIAYRQLASFRFEASLGSWIARIAVHEALARVRTSTRRNGLALVDDAADVPAESRSPEDHVAARETAKLLERHIDALPETYRTAFVLRDVEELSTAETARVLGVTEEAVRVRLHRARRILQGTLADTVGLAVPGVFRFDGDRCDAIVAGVMRALDVESL
jgi:RNA polymerase sigma-70 factor (ECF subfamily)